MHALFSFGVYKPLLYSGSTVEYVCVYKYGESISYSKLYFVTHVTYGMV